MCLTATTAGCKLAEDRCLFCHGYEINTRMFSTKLLEKKISVSPYMLRRINYLVVLNCYCMLTSMLFVIVCIIFASFGLQLGTVIFSRNLTETAPHGANMVPTKTPLDPRRFTTAIHMEQTWDRCRTSCLVKPRSLDVLPRKQIRSGASPGYTVPIV